MDPQEFKEVIRTVILNLQISTIERALSLSIFRPFKTTIPHVKLKNRLASIIQNSFIFENGNRRYKYLVLGHEEAYIVKEHAYSKSKYTEDDIIKMLEFSWFLRERFLHLGRTLFSYSSR